jgi:dipeptidyl aminopeptidase/acylaminoacyl peptidase
MNGDGGEKFSLSREEVCPVIPVNGGERAVTVWAGPGDPVLGTIQEEGFEPLPGRFSPLGYSAPERQAGPLDGIIDPTGRTMVVVLEVEPGTGDSSDLLRWPDGIGPFDPAASLDLFLIDLDNGARTRLTEDAARDYEPRFIPDGSGIVWGSQRDGPGDLYHMDLESGEVRRLTYGTLPARDPSVQGSRIAFHRGWGDGDQRGDQEIYLLEMETGVERRLTENDWNDTGPELSYDGRMICWTSKGDGHFEGEILAMDLETGDSWSVSEGLVRGDYCQWHPSAPVVFFQGWDVGEEEIYRSSWGGRPPHLNLSRYVGKDVAPSIFLAVGQTSEGG